MRTLLVSALVVPFALCGWGLLAALGVHYASLVAFLCPMAFGLIWALVLARAARTHLSRTERRHAGILQWLRFLEQLARTSPTIHVRLTVVRYGEMRARLTGDVSARVPAVFLNGRVQASTEARRA